MPAKSQPPTRKSRTMRVRLPIIAPLWCIFAPTDANASLWCNDDKGKTMASNAEILERARKRDTSLPYAGAVTPQEAYTLLR
jgi:hypothetical protein